MAETKLKLVKNQKRENKSIGKATATNPRPSLQIAALPTLTPAERAEAARFKALTSIKAARQAMLHRIMSELQELDETQSAA
jgi:hypothetical protein